MELQSTHRRNTARDPYRECRSYTRTHARSFYFASHVLPKEKRLAAYAVYTFCRYADNVVDAAGSSPDRDEVRRRLSSVRDLLERVYAGSSDIDPLWTAFQETVNRYGIPREYFVALLRGASMDVEKQRYANFVELQEYCYNVASVVGLAMTRIFGVSDAKAYDHALELGTAMQLTNILRDVGEDFALGRIYIPSDELVRFSVSEKDISDGMVSPEFKALMAFQIARAREYYRRAAEGIPMLTDDGSRFCVTLMSRSYAQILDAIETNGYDVFRRRAYVPFLSKLRLAASTYLSHRAASAGKRIMSGRHA